MSSTRSLIRFFWRRRSLTALACLLLGLGLAANGVVFGTVYSVLLRPFPYTEADRIIQIYSVDPKLGTDSGWLTHADFRDLRQRSSVFAALCGYEAEAFDLFAGGEPERVEAVKTMGDPFEVLDVEPLHGRTLAGAEERPGTQKVAVLSHALWQRHMGGDREAIGQQIRLSDEPYTVVGVMPPDFWFPSKETLLWVPATPKEDTFRRPGAFNVQAVGRLRRGVSQEAAQAQMSVIAEGLAREFPQTNQGVGLRLVALPDGFAEAFVKPLMVLQGAGFLILLLAWTDLGGLLQAQYLLREQEFAVRRALGTGRLRLLGRLIAEGLVLSGLGALVAVVLTAWGVRLVAVHGPHEVPRLSEARLEPEVALFLVGLALLSGTVLGLATLLAGIGRDPVGALRAGDRQVNPTRWQRRLLNVLVVVEVALAFLLLATAGLLAQTFFKLRTIDLGMDIENIVTVQIKPPSTRYRNPEQYRSFYDRLLAGVSALPAVEAVGLTNPTPLDLYSNSHWLQIEGRVRSESEAQQWTDYRIVTPGYFEALRMPLLRGRQLEERDGREETPGALVSESTVRQYFRGEDPLGRRVGIGPLREDLRFFEIVGVVGDVRDVAVEREPTSQIYLPSSLTAPGRSRTLVVRSRGEPLGLVAEIRGVVQGLDPELPLFNVSRLQDRFARSLASYRFLAVLLLLFAAIGTVMAVLGVYSVLSHSVSQRRREVGLRIALGADESTIYRLLMKHGLALCGLGLVAGLAAALIVARSVHLHGVEPLSVWAMAVAAVLLALLGCLASYLPARRAVSSEALTSIRS